MSKKRVGFYGGTFDPIHFGHLNLSIELAEHHKIDQVFFCPAGLAPNKKNAKPKVSYSHRYQMVKEAIAPFPTFTLLDYEKQENEVSFTYDTMVKFKGSMPDADLYLFLADDTMATLSTWKEIEKLLEIAMPLTARRLREAPSFLNLSDKAAKRVEAGLTDTSLFEISSTMIRERLKKRLPCPHLLPEKVLDYIYKNQLYL